MTNISKHTLIYMGGAGLVSIVVGWLLFTAFDRSLSHATAANYEKQQALFADSIAQDIEQYFYDVQKRVETIALMPSIRNAVRGEACNQELQDILEVNKNEFNNLGRISKDGLFVCAVNRSIIGEPASKYGTYFAQLQADPAHKPVMSALIRPTGAGSEVIAVHVPVYDDQNNFAGSIGGAVYFDELEKRLLSDKKLSTNSTIVVHDNNGDILYHPDPLIRGKNILAPEMLSQFSPESTIRAFAEIIKTNGAKGKLEYTLRGQQRVGRYASAQVIGRSWNVNVAVPLNDIEKAAQENSARRIFIVAVITSLLFTFSAAILLIWRSQRHPGVNKKK